MKSDIIYPCREIFFLSLPFSISTSKAGVFFPRSLSLQGAFNILFIICLSNKQKERERFCGSISKRPLSAAQHLPTYRRTDLRSGEGCGAPGPGTQAPPLQRGQWGTARPHAGVEESGTRPHAAIPPAAPGPALCFCFCSVLILSSLFNFSTAQCLLSTRLPAKLFRAPGQQTVPIVYDPL